VNVAIDALLIAAVAAAWLGALAFLRLSTAFERLHVVTFVNVVTLGLVVAAAFVADGISSRSLKSALVLVIALAAGVLLWHTSPDARRTWARESGDALRTFPGVNRFRACLGVGTRRSLRD
jgi:multisubunit Na+/H+ antiporter MnhG subunit